MISETHAPQLPERFKAHRLASSIFLGLGPVMAGEFVGGVEIADEPSLGEFSVHGLVVGMTETSSAS